MESRGGEELFAIGASTFGNAPRCKARRKQAK